MAPRTAAWRARQALRAPGRAAAGCTRCCARALALRAWLAPARVRMPQAARPDDVDELARSLCKKRVCWIARLLVCSCSGCVHAAFLWWPEWFAGSSTNTASRPRAATGVPVSGGLLRNSRQPCRGHKSGHQSRQPPDTSSTALSASCEGRTRLVTPLQQPVPSAWAAAERLWLREIPACSCWRASSSMAQPCCPLVSCCCSTCRRPAARRRQPCTAVSWH